LRAGLITFVPPTADTATTGAAGDDGAAIAEETFQLEMSGVYFLWIVTRLAMWTPSNRNAVAPKEFQRIVAETLLARVKTLKKMRQTHCCLRDLLGVCASAKGVNLDEMFPLPADMCFLASCKKLENPADVNVTELGNPTGRKIDSGMIVQNGDMAAYGDLILVFGQLLLIIQVKQWIALLTRTSNNISWGAAENSFPYEYVKAGLPLSKKARQLYGLPSEQGQLFRATWSHDEIRNGAQSCLSDGHDQRVHVA
jgi:hypothetical protein